MNASSFLWLLVGKKVYGKHKWLANPKIVAILISYQKHIRSTLQLYAIKKKNESFLLENDIHVGLKTCGKL